MKVFLYDKVKNTFMPYDTHKYHGLDYLWRSAFSFSILTGVSTLLVYPLDLAHTRLTTDITPKKSPRLFYNTFDVMNRTHVDEGKAGLYKGAQVAVLSAALRAGLGLPLYDAVRTTFGSDNKGTGYFNNLN
jgi:Mitochondrial carrier protein